MLRQSQGVHTALVGLSGIGDGIAMIRRALVLFHIEITHRAGFQVLGK
jgi:hypothetical protein